MGIADEITAAKRLLDSGAITQSEFDRIKARALAGSAGQSGYERPQSVRRSRGAVWGWLGGAALVIILVGIYPNPIRVGGGSGGSRSSTADTFDSEKNMTAIRAKRVLKRRLKDPESAQFQDVFASNDMVCGTYNSKNSLGGYGQYEPFIGIGPGEPQVLLFKDKGFRKAWDASCLSLTGFIRID